MKGSLPLLILRVLVDGPNHGYRIASHIKDQSGGVLDYREGTLYPTLHSLEKDGLITSTRRKENGRQRRYYELTEAGHAALDEGRAEWASYMQAVNKVLGKA